MWCDENATYEAEETRCVCKNGYEGNGIVCSKKGEVLLYIVTVATQVLIYIHKVIMPIIIATWIPLIVCPRAIEYMWS